MDEDDHDHEWNHWSFAMAKLNRPFMILVICSLSKLKNLIFGLGFAKISETHSSANSN